MDAAAVEELRAEVARLAAKLEALSSERAQLAAEREHYQALYLDTLEKMRKLELGLLGQKAERLPANEAQLSMALLAELLGREPTPEPTGEEKKRKVREHERFGAGFIVIHFGHVPGASGGAAIRGSRAGIVIHSFVSQPGVTSTSWA